MSCFLRAYRAARRVANRPRSVATGEPEGILHRTSDRYAPDAEETDRINATILALVRNEEVDDMVQSMVDLERTWNSKFNYPWTFFNDVPFTEEFKKKTSAVTKAKCNYGEDSVSPFAFWDTTDYSSL